MPVQDNEQPKQAEQFFENDEERRRQAMQNSQENSVQKSQKLLPFLNAKAENHQSRINNLNEKIATREDKIARNEAKIEKLSEKADRLEDRNTMLRNTLGNIPLVQKLIERSEAKIEDIRSVKIPKRESAIKKHQQKIGQFEGKREKIGHKLNRVVALNDVIKSFAISFNKERREVFTDAMDRFNAANVDCLTDKKNALVEKRNKLVEVYNSPETSTVDRLNISDKVRAVNEKINDFEDKIHKLARPENHFAEQTNDMVDATMFATADTISNAVENGNVGMTELAETLFIEADKVEKLDLSEVANLADKFNSLENAEMAIEDAYNFIDGVINNGSKEDLLKAQKELSETLDSMKDIVGNKHMMQSVREDVEKDIPNIEKQLEAVNKALERFAPTVDDKGKVNPDFYKSLPKEQRHIESMTERQAEKVMASLSAVGIEFSAVKRESGNTAITVAKSDAPALKDMMKNAQKEIEEESKQAWRSLGDDFVEAYEETHTAESVNPDFRKSLDNDDKVNHVESKGVAEKIMERLNNHNIPYSAVIRPNGSTTITVSKDDDKTYRNIADFIKENRAVQFVNPDFFKSLPVEKRDTKPMTQEQAEQRAAKLTQEGIPFSAVLNGDKSAVTVEKKDVKSGFFSRDKLKRSAQRVSEKGKERTERPKSRSKNQGLE